MMIGNGLVVESGGSSMIAKIGLARKKTVKAFAMKYPNIRNTSLRRDLYLFDIADALTNRV